MVRRHRRMMSEINVVPYIDVMLVLLVIFMITTPLLSQGVKVDLPKAKANVLSAEKTRNIIVSVDAKGQYFLNVAADNAKPISPQDILNTVTRELAAAKAHDTKVQVLVKGDKAVDYGQVVQAMVLLQKAGAGNIGLITEPGPDDTAEHL